MENVDAHESPELGPINYSTFPFRRRFDLYLHTHTISRRRAEIAVCRGAMDIFNVSIPIETKMCIGEMRIARDPAEMECAGTKVN